MGKKEGGRDGGKKRKKKKNKGEGRGDYILDFKSWSPNGKTFPLFFFITSSMVHIVGTHIEVRIIGINKPERFKQKFAK